MAHQLDNSHPGFIKMTVTGLVEKKSLVTAISDLMGHPDYPVKHTLWDFSGAAMGLSFDDFGEIAGVLRLYKTPRKFANRSALVVPGPMDMSMARIYVSLSRLLPFDYKVFDSCDQALEFLPPASKEKN